MIAPNASAASPHAKMRGCGTYISSGHSVSVGTAPSATKVGASFICVTGLLSPVRGTATCMLRCTRTSPLDAPSTMMAPGIAACRRAVLGRCPVHNSCARNRLEGNSEMHGMMAHHETGVQLLSALSLHDPLFGAVGVVDDLRWDGEVQSLSENGFNVHFTERRHDCRPCEQRDASRPPVNLLSSCMLSSYFCNSCFRE